MHDNYSYVNTHYNSTMNMNSSIELVEDITGDTVDSQSNSKQSSSLDCASFRKV